MRLKARLQAQGLFDAQRKRPLPTMPRGIGIVTSPGAAALHDVVSTLRRRVPHIPVLLVPALVQGAQAPASLCEALSKMYLLAMQGRGETLVSAQNPAGLALPASAPPIDVILLVRGGGSMEDLWAFNDENLAHQLVQSPVPVISGVGHETDFTIADFCADLRAPTPTAAAELVAQPRAVAGCAGVVGAAAVRWAAAPARSAPAAAGYDRAAPGPAISPGGPAAAAAGPVGTTPAPCNAIEFAAPCQRPARAGGWFASKSRQALERQHQQLQALALRLELLNPQHVLQRGYALLTDAQGQAVTDAAQLRPGDALQARLARGQVDVTVSQRRLL